MIRAVNKVHIDFILILNKFNGTWKKNVCRIYSNGNHLVNSPGIKNVFYINL